MAEIKLRIAALMGVLAIPATATASPYSDHIAAAEKAIKAKDWKTALSELDDAEELAPPAARFSSLTSFATGVALLGKVNELVILT